MSRDTQYVFERLPPSGWAVGDVAALLDCSVRVAAGHLLALRRLGLVESWPELVLWGGPVLWRRSSRIA